MPDCQLDTLPDEDDALKRFFLADVRDSSPARVGKAPRQLAGAAIMLLNAAFGLSRPTRAALHASVEAILWTLDTEYGLRPPTLP
jgi:hypothetical protein